MTAKKLKKNLKNYLTPFFEIPIHIDEENGDRELPCIIITHETETLNDFMDLHYVVGGSVVVAVQGYDDTVDNAELETLSNDVMDALVDWDSLCTSLNKPLSGGDERPATEFTCHRLYVQGAETIQEDSSTFYEVKWEAFNYNGDS